MPTLESQLSMEDIHVSSPGAHEQTNETPNNAITLTFNGVDFRLVPITSHDDSSSSISMTNVNGKFTTIQLESFTGSLVVSTSALTSLAPSSSSNTTPAPVRTPKDHSHQSSQATNTVEDESSDPEGEPEPKSRSRPRSRSPPPSQVSRRGGNGNGNGNKKGIKLPNGQKQLSFLKHNNQNKKKDQEKSNGRKNNKRGNVSTSATTNSSALKNKKARTSTSTEKETDSLTMSSFLRLGQTMASQSQSQLSQSQSLSQTQNENCCSQSSRSSGSSSTVSADLLSHSRLQTKTKRSRTIEEMIQTQGDDEEEGEEMTQIVRYDHDDDNDKDGLGNTNKNTGEGTNTSESTRIVEESPIANAIMELDNEDDDDDDDDDIEDNDQINALFNDGTSSAANAIAVTTPLKPAATSSSNQIIEVGVTNSISSIVSPPGTTAVSIAANADMAMSTPSPLRIPTPDKNSPCPRWGHTMTLIEDSKVLVYGGQTLDGDSVKTLTDLHVYDMVKRTWSKPINCEGMPRTWHSATFLPDRQLLISFGGEYFNEKTKKTCITDQVMVLDTEIMLWYPPSVFGSIPSGRSGHTASLLPNTNELIIFGGVKNNKWQKSLAVLDTMRWKWSVPKISGMAPRARSYHTATPIPSSNLLVIFGGNNETQCFNTVHVLDTKDENWTWSHPTVNCSNCAPPRPRTGHVATLLEDGKTILIYGGWDPNDEEVSEDNMIFGDSFLLNTETWTWRVGPKPKFLAHQQQQGINNGGLNRTGAASALAPGVDTSQVLIFGGRVPTDETFSNDFQSCTVPHRMIGM